MTMLTQRNHIKMSRIVWMMIFISLLSAMTFEIIRRTNSPATNQIVNYGASLISFWITQAIFANGSPMNGFTCFCFAILALVTTTRLSPAFCTAIGLFAGFTLTRQPVFRAILVKLRQAQNALAFGTTFRYDLVRHIHSFLMSMFWPSGTIQAAFLFTILTRTGE